MASGNNARGQRVSYKPVSTALSSAAAEWLLMLLLFLDGFFSFLVTKFAHYFKLQKPCLFCSRLDHILGQERPGFYKDLTCHAHKLEISSLAFCHIHEKLADVQDMCEACLLSFATEKKSNSETYRSLVGKLERNLVTREDPHLRLPAPIYPGGLEVKFQGEDLLQVPLLKDQTIDSLRTRYCSCCRELFSEKSPVHRLLQNKSIGAEGQELDVALFGQTGHDCLHSGDGSSKRRENSLGSAASPHIENQSLGPLSHIGYTELKVTSDSESEVPLSDDDDRNAPVRTDDLMVDMLSQSLERELSVDSESQIVLPKILLDETTLEKQIHPTPALPEPSSLLPVEQIHPVEHDDGDLLVPKSTLGQGLEEQIRLVEHDDGDLLVRKSTLGQALEELSWKEFKEKDQTSPTSKYICEMPDSNLDDAEVSHVENCVATTEGNDHPVLDKVISEVSNLKLDEVEIGDPAPASSATNTEEPRNLNSTEMGLRQIQTRSDPGALMHNHMDLNDAYKLAISNRMNQPSPRDSYRVHEDLRVLISQASAARGLEFPWSDMTPSPRVHGLGDDLKMSDASSTTSQQNLYKRLSIERNESGFESLDGSIVSELEGESPVDRLKRQIDLDRKSMSLLYKELEEERSASAIAVNQAMAMITRLQEEKAAMQMEALQYQRMMEEQAEYDQEALQKSNDLLAQREEELQDLKDDIESYKKWLGVESSSTKMKGDLEQTEDTVCRPLVKPSAGKKILERNDTVFLDAEGDKGAISRNSLLDFDDEKLYISECLNNLERKLHLFSNDGVHVDVSRPHAREDVLCVPVLGNGHLHEKDTSEVNNSEQGHWQEIAQEGSQLGEDAFLNQKEPSFEGGDSHMNSEGTDKENHIGISRLPNFEGENPQSTTISRTAADLVDIGNEVLCLNYRLEALEADRNFLEHTMKSLRSGNDGIQLVQEIASHLRELRKIGVRRKEQAFT